LRCWCGYRTGWPRRVRSRDARRYGRLALSALSGLDMLPRSEGHVRQDGVIDWVVMCCLGLGSGGFQGKRRLAADLVGAEAGHGLERHVAVLELPLVVLLHQDGSDEAQDAGLVREDADHVGAGL